MATNNKDYLYDRTALISEYEDFLNGDGLNASVESFTSFLKAYKLPTTHASEIYKYITEENVNLQVGDLQIRKSHPVWDYIRKKVLYPAAITGGVIGVTTGAIATSGLISGSNFMGFLPVFSNPALTFGATATIGAGIGAAGTVAFITGKDLAVRQYYKIRYKNAATNLQQLQEGLDLKNISMIQLMEKIEATSKEIFTLGEHSPRRALLNKINRNRIHHLESIIVDLYPMWTKLDRFIARAKKEKDHSALENFLKQKELLEQLLVQADKFINSNIKEAKLNALLTCKEKGKHSHSTVENVDIYATICNKLDAVKRHSSDKDVKKMHKNTTLKKQTAERLISGERRLIPELIEKTASKTTEKERVVDVTPVTKTSIKVKPSTKTKTSEPKTSTTTIKPKHSTTTAITKPKTSTTATKPVKASTTPATTVKPAEPKKSAELITPTTKTLIRDKSTTTANARRKKIEEMKNREVKEFSIPIPTKKPAEPKVEVPIHPQKETAEKPKNQAKKPDVPKTEKSTKKTADSKKEPVKTPAKTESKAETKKQPKKEQKQPTTAKKEPNKKDPAKQIKSETKNTTQKSTEPKNTTKKTFESKNTNKDSVKETKNTTKVNNDKVLVATAVLEKLNDPTFVSTQINGTTALQYITSKNTPKTFIIEQVDVDTLKVKLKEWLKSPEQSQLRLYGKQDDLFKYIKFRTIRNMHTTVQSL